MTRLRMLCAWALALAFAIGPATSQAQETSEDEEEDSTAEAEVSSDDLWGDDAEEEEAAEEEEEAAAATTTPWSASLEYGHETLLRPYLVSGEDADPTYNPSYTHSLTIAPGWSFDDHWSLGANVGLSQELTNPDDRTGRYDVWVSSRLDVAYAKLVELYEISLTPSLRVVFPTSPAQQAATLYFSLGPGFSLARPFDVLQGLKLTYGFRFTKNFHRYAEASSPPQPIGCESAENQADCTTTSQGNRNTNFSLRNSLSAELAVTDKLSFGISTGVAHSLAYSLTDATLDDALTGDSNGVVNANESIDGNDAQGGWRYLYSFGISADYKVMSYLTASASIGVGDSPQLDPSSELYNPLIPNRSTTAGLSVSLSLDELVKQMGPTRASRSQPRIANNSSESR